MVMYFILRFSDPLGRCARLVSRAGKWQLLTGSPGGCPYTWSLMQDPVTVPEPHDMTPVSWWRRWWRRQTPVHQDRFAMLAPLAAVLLFLAAIIAAFGYLRLEEMDREQEAVKRDVEYAQQR